MIARQLKLIPNASIIEFIKQPFRGPKRPKIKNFITGRAGKIRVLTIFTFINGRAEEATMFKVWASEEQSYERIL